MKFEARNSKPRIAQLALIALLAIVFIGADTDARFNKLGHGLMCACGCNQVLLECNHVGCTYSDRMRNELMAAIVKDDSNGGSGGGGVNNDSMILQSFVQKYGATVLAAPTTTGFNLTAWIVPAATFIVAFAFTVWFVIRWKSRAIAQPVPSPELDAEQLDDLRKKARKETEF